VLQWGHFNPTKAAMITGSCGANKTASGKIIDGPWFEEAKAAAVFVYTRGGVSHSSLMDLQLYVLCAFVLLS
jgi:hypothetical protein